MEIPKALFALSRREGAPRFRSRRDAAPTKPLPLGSDSHKAAPTVLHVQRFGQFHGATLF